VVVDPETNPGLPDMDGAIAKIEALADGYNKIQEIMLDTKAALADLKLEEEKLKSELESLEKSAQTYKEKISPVQEQIGKNKTLTEALKSGKRSSGDKELRLGYGEKILRLETETATLQDSIAEALRDLEKVQSDIKRAKENIEDIRGKRKEFRNSFKSLAKSRDTLRRYGNEAKIEKNRMSHQEKR
jgi:chromosome segregation ATPase